MSAPARPSLPDVDVTPADYQLAVVQAAQFAAKARTADRSVSADEKAVAATLALAAEVRALRVGLLGAEAPRGGWLTRLLRVMTK